MRVFGNVAPALGERNVLAFCFKSAAWQRIKVVPQEDISSCPCNLQGQDFFIIEVRIMKKIIVGISGADGVCMGVRLLELLQPLKDVETHVVLTQAAEKNLEYEGFAMGQVRALADCFYAADDMCAKIASGSFLTEGMLIVPCSMKSLAAICSGYTDNLLQLAADVCLKEKRRVVLVPREMPLGRVHLRNLLTADELGCTIVPPVLTFYNKPASVQDHIDHILAKALLQFGIVLPTFKPWEGREHAGI